jgi:Outer membrane protein beta-barrel domain
VSRLAIVIGAAFLAVPSFAHAQYLGRELPHTGTFEVSGGGLWTGGYSFETVSANETRNPTTGSGPLTLFQGEPRLDGGGGAEAHLGVYLGRQVSVEGGFQFSRRSLLVRTSNDFESAPDTTASASVTQYVIDGSLLYHFGSGRLIPFVSGGAGYLRQLIQDGSTVETGNEIHGGGGVKYWLGAGRRFGVRAEVRLSSLSGGLSLDGTTKRRFVPTFSGGVAYLF